ncbi:hypothetical protein ACIPPS_15210 [Streptomyces sp. NPDC090127]
MVGLFPRTRRPRPHDEDDENNPDYAPDSPPDWARVVVIGA